MNIKNLKKDARNILALLTILAVTSCNRGYGCPTNFSVEDLLVQVIKAFLAVWF